MSDLLYEIGTEELPPALISNLVNQIKENIIKKLKDEYIELVENEIKTYSTPRRIAIYIPSIPLKQEVKKQEIKGPDTEKAFDKAGNPTQAAIGFAKKYNLETKDLKTKEINNSKYLVATVTTGGKDTKELLKTILPESIKNTTGKKFMSWGNNDEKFARPIRWILALFDNKTIDFSYAGIKTSNFTFGHRLHNGKKIVIDCAKDYETILEKNHVIACQKTRKEKIRDQILSEAKKAQGEITHYFDQLLEEVTNIVEYPSPLLCSFKKEYLSLPKEIIETVLVKHQKYFALTDRTKTRLLPDFIVITNGTGILNNTNEIVKKGNEKVIKARLNDAQFFYNEDIKTKFGFENRINSLSEVTFQENLGSMKEKVERLIKLSEYIYDELSRKGNFEIKKDDIIQTAKLCKLDLTTHVVFEFTELQGEVGSIYATLNNYNEIISKGIKEHYYPRYFGDNCPESITGLIVGIADKIDNIVCMFAINKIPSGSADPFALRRQAQGIIDNILHKNIQLNISTILNTLINEILNSKIKERLTSERLAQIKDFIIQRFIFAMENKGFENDIITSVVSVGNILDDIASAKSKIEAISKERNKTQFKEFLTAAKRLVRIVEKHTNGNIDTNILTTEEEKTLLKKIDELNTNLNNSKYPKPSDFIVDLSRLTEPINKFFDKVLVNDPDPKIKQTRQALLKKGKDLFENICDFNLIQEKN